MEKSTDINLKMPKEEILDNDVDNEEIELTEEDIQHLLKSEEDIRMGRTYTLEEVIKNLEKECGFRYYKI